MPHTSTKTVPEPDATPGATIRVDIPDDFGWTIWRQHDSAAWFKGGFTENGRWREGIEAARLLAARLDPFDDVSVLGRTVDALDGHFAVVVKRAGRVVVAVDRVRSIPLCLARGPDGVTILDRPRRWLQRTETPVADPAGSLEVAMAGYAIGRATLYADVTQITGGELAVVGVGLREPLRHRYYAYRAWELAKELPFGRRVEALGEVTRAVFEKLVAGLDGRPVLVPLSAGLDSRLVVTGLLEAGARDIVCYAYGRPGNHEAEVSRAIADRLGLPWHFVPYSPARVRAFTDRALFLEYIASADSLTAVPFMQDLLALSELLDRGVVPKDAIVINGNSGDFITGGHIPSTLHDPRTDLDPAMRRRRVADAQLEKHFSLWRDLRTEANDEAVRARLNALVDEQLEGMPLPEADHGAYEFLECHGRQGNFVITGQRVYEFLDLGWRLPLWDCAWLDYWCGQTLEAKADQRLYRAFLTTANWGGVWERLDYGKTVRPRWVGALRFAAKVAAAPLGRAQWHALDRRVFGYWTDILSTYSVAPYTRLLFDRRGFRNAVALRAEAYLADHGRGPDGRPSDQSAVR